MKKVVKFGGSSLASAEQFKKVGDIIRADKSRRYVVPSAPGKRSSSDTKVTDMLYSCYNLAIREKKFTSLLDEIHARYNEIIDGLNLELSLDHEFDMIRENFGKKIGRDYAASRGEYLNGIIMANYLGFCFIDAAEVIRFHEDGSLDDEKTNELLSLRLEGEEFAVIPGFYGAKEDGTIVTFSRGGSDITGSLVARAAMADLYENWTDVSGFLIADPRIVTNPKSIETITYRELRELSYMGATVLHEDAIFPVRKVGIPINIRNTNAPQDKGTLIVESTCRQPKYTITGIAGTDGFAAVTIEKAMMNSEIGFCRKVLEEFDKNGISIEHMPSGIDTMTIFVADGVDTLVFDEVDAGVGGSTARALAGVLADLASTHQVIVVTHLAQVAVMADKHYVVSKEPGDVPQTHLDEVTGEARTAEIARMLSGDQSEASLAHAKQMLEEARG